MTETWTEAVVPTVTPYTPDPDLDDDDPHHTHIVKRQPGETRPMEVVVLEARINGTPLVALCGYTWVPTRDPNKHPLCETCKKMARRLGSAGFN